MTTSMRQSYRPTESQYKGGASEMYVTYQVQQRTRGGGSILVPKVKRAYIAGDVTTWSVGDHKKRSGRRVFGVRIEYTQTRSGYRRAGFMARRGSAAHETASAHVDPTTQRFTRVIGLSARAQNIQFYERRRDLPERYAHALQAVR